MEQEVKEIFTDLMSEGAIDSILEMASLFQQDRPFLAVESSGFFESLIGFIPLLTWEGNNSLREKYTIHKDFGEYHVMVYPESMLSFCADVGRDLRLVNIYINPSVSLFDIKIELYVYI